MKLVTDAFFSIGKTHTVCQDYARAGVDRVVISDGCSSSPDTDIGARLQCLATLRDLEAADRVGLGIQGLDTLGLPSGALDATNLSVVVVDGESGPEFVVHAWGDGIVLLRKRDGGFVVYSIAYPSGAPFYASYVGDTHRFARYATQFGFKRKIEIVNSDGTQDTFEDDEAQPFNLSASPSFFDLVMVGSDGWLSGQRSVESATSRTFESVPLADVVAELTAFKSMTGEFIQRRCRRMLETWAKKGWHFNDDVSLAGVYVAEPKEST